MVYKVVGILRVSFKDEVELAAYQLKGVTQVCFIQWMFERVEEGPTDWEMFKDGFLDRFFLMSQRRLS